MPAIPTHMRFGHLFGRGFFSYLHLLCTRVPSEAQTDNLQLRARMSAGVKEFLKN